MSRKRCGIKIKLKRIFSPVFEAALDSRVQLMMSRTQAEAIHTHYKIRRGVKILKTKTVIISKPYKNFQS